MLCGSAILRAKERPLLQPQMVTRKKVIEAG
jgi:hypothetical protein